MTALYVGLAFEGGVRKSRVFTAFCGFLGGAYCSGSFDTSGSGCFWRAAFSGFSHRESFETGRNETPTGELRRRRWASKGVERGEARGRPAARAEAFGSGRGARRPLITLRGPPDYAAGLRARISRTSAS